MHWLYDHENDDWLPIASGAFSPALAAGACGCYSDWSPAYTANGGSTTTVTVALSTHNLNKAVADCLDGYEMFLSGGEWDKPLVAWKYPNVKTGMHVTCLK